MLAKGGNTKVVSSRKKEGSEAVYNLEVKEVHNFLVGEFGVVVHNSCFLTNTSNLPTLNVLPEWLNEIQTASNSWLNPAGIFRDAQGRKIIKVIPDNVENWQWDQGFDFVITRNGQLKIGSGHGFMAGHKNANTNPDIFGAGKIKINKNTGKIEWVNDQSGHYQPNASQFEMIEQKFIDEGLLY